MISSTSALCTTVLEYCTFSKNFNESQKPVSILNLDSCYCLTIENKDEKGTRTAFSATHFKSSQADSKSLIKENLSVILKEFEKCGGDIKSATFTVHGGKGTQRQSRLMNLWRAIKEEVPEAQIKTSAVSNENEVSKNNIEIMFSKLMGAATSFDILFCKESSIACKAGGSNSAVLLLALR